MSIALIVHSQNEDDVVKFCEQHKALLQNAFIFATRTESNKISTIFSKNVEYVVSLDSKGDATITAKVGRGEINAVYYFFPPPESLVGLNDLIQECSRKKVYFALDPATGGCVLQRLAAGMSL